MYYDTVTEILDDEGEGEREREEEMREGECITPLSASIHRHWSYLRCLSQTWSANSLCCC